MATQIEEMTIHYLAIMVHKIAIEPRNPKEAFLVIFGCSYLKQHTILSKIEIRDIEQKRGKNLRDTTIIHQERIVDY